MELGLSLGDSPCRTLSLVVDKGARSADVLGFPVRGGGRNNMIEGVRVGDGGSRDTDGVSKEGSDSVGRPVQLELLPLRPVPRASPAVHAWQGENDPSSVARGFDVNQLPVGDEMEDRAGVSSPNSAVSSFRMDLSICRQGATGSGGNDNENERTTSRASDEEENGSTRKKLRLSKEQSAFLEESFKEHNTLNPKQKLALAKQLNLRPRQVEVWFQNRRARTKLKQTEVDCEYLKRCCETLTEENRRLQKELQELRALKTAQPFYMQLPATTLTMCPSCERVATTTTAAAPSSDGGNKSSAFGQAAATPMPRNRFFPFSPQHQSAAS